MTLEEALDLFPFTAWSISRNCARALYERVQKLNARVIVDFGSGASTIALAHYARETGARLVSFEHDPDFYKVTKRVLVEAELLQFADLRLARIAPLGGHRGYVVDELPNDIDFVFIDGPPGTIGRRGTLPSVASKLAPKWEVWLHDGLRPGEQADVRAWQKKIPFTARLSTLEDNRGVFILSPGT